MDEYETYEHGEAGNVATPDDDAIGDFNSPKKPQRSLALWLVIGSLGVVVFLLLILFFDKSTTLDRTREDLARSYDTHSDLKAGRDDLLRLYMELKERINALQAERNTLQDALRLVSEVEVAKADTLESVLVEGAQMTRKFNSELEGIKTVEDIKKAAGSLKKLRQRQKVLAEKRDKLGQTSDEEAFRIGRKFLHRVDDTVSESRKLIGNMKRLTQLSASDPEAAKILAEMGILLR